MREALSNCVRKVPETKEEIDTKIFIIKPPGYCIPTV